MNLHKMQQLTKDLIAIDSVSGNEGEIAQFLTEELRRRGMQVRTFEVSPGRKNIMAAWTESHPKILFNTHIDTVAKQYGPYEDEQRIYGRGACDTHGILATQLEAMQDLRDEKIDGLGILLVVGEETTHDGALHAGTCPDIVEPDSLIVGEPTENRLMISQKGRLKLDLIIHGSEGHSGYPERFDSATEKLFRALDALWRAPWLKRHSAEGTTMNVIILVGGDADNKIPGQAHARLLFRCAEKSENIRTKVTDAIASLQKKMSRPDTRHFELKWDPAANDPLTDLAVLPGFETGTAAFNTDIAYFGWKNCKTFLVGPGSILQAHRDLKEQNWEKGEWILKKEQAEGVELYKKLVRTLAS